jgi:hypothetical protein
MHSAQSSSMKARVARELLEPQAGG